MPELRAIRGVKGAGSNTNGSADSIEARMEFLCGPLRSATHPLGFPEFHFHTTDNPDEVCQY